MADRHLNLFYTYNRDSELIENNLTRAFIVFLSIVSGGTRHRILSNLVGESSMLSDGSASIESLDFTNADFALQSNIDRHISRNSARKMLLTISTEPLDISSGMTANESMSGDDFRSVPDAWIYDVTRDYCVLIEVKAGSYPLDVGQLQAHAIHWLDTNLQSLDSHNALYSVTWAEVLRVLKEILNEHPNLNPSEKTLVSHMEEFIGFYGYRLFDGFDFSDACDSPGFMVRVSPSSEGDVLELDFHKLSAVPDFTFK
ncbi:MAG: hypothetical protein M3494_03250 [Actinomycetota bacterium]|jgi:hypothetical protein|nr:hypothetical protein [Actinomycetota bacterium]